MLFPLSICWFSKKKSGFLLTVLAVAMLWGRFLYAYTDTIEARPEDIWRAAEQVLKPHGIHKSDISQWMMESRWIEDRVERSKRLVPLNSSPVIKQIYLRRYRLRIQLKTSEDSRTELSIRGKFQQKETQALPQLHWRPVKPGLEDYNIERDFFFRILMQLGSNRQANPFS